MTSPIAKLRLWILDIAREAVRGELANYVCTQQGIAKESYPLLSEYGKISVTRAVYPGRVASKPEPRPTESFDDMQAEAIKQCEVSDE